MIHQPNLTMSITKTKSPDGQLYVVFFKNNDDMAVNDSQLFGTIFEWGRRGLTAELRAQNRLGEQSITAKDARIFLTASSGRKAFSAVLVSEAQEELSDIDAYALLMTWAEKVIGLELKNSEVN